MYSLENYIDIIHKKNLEFYLEVQNLRTAKAVLSGRNNDKSVIISNFKLYYRSVVQRAG